MPVAFSVTVLVFLWVCSEAQESDSLLSVDRCVQIALERGYYRQRNEGERQLTKVGIYDALSAVLPFLGASAGFSRNGPERQLIIEDPTSPPIPGEEVWNDQFQTSITLSTPLIDAASIAGLRQAKTVWDNADVVFRGAQAELAYDVKQAFYNLLGAYKSLDASRAAVLQLEEQVAVARQRFELGAISRPELLRVEVDLSRQKIDFTNSKTALEAEMRNLAGLMGVNYPVQIDTSLLFPDTTEDFPSLDSVMKSVLNSNPSLLSANLNLQARQSGELSVKLRKIPALGAEFTYGYADREVGFRNWGERDFWSWGIQLNWNIFERMSWYGQLRGASAQVLSAKAVQEITKSSVIQQANQAYSDFLSSREALSTALVLREQAQEQLRLAQEQFRLGAGSALELSQSQAVYLESLRESVQIIVNYYLARARLLFLAGAW